MSYIRFLRLLTCGGVQHILRCVVFFLSMLPVFLDCPFLIAPSVFTNVYLFIDNTCRRGYLNILKLKHFLYTDI